MWQSKGATSLALVLAVACGDSENQGGSGVGGSGAGGNANPGACDPATLCLDIVEEAPITEGRFAIVWFRLEGSVAADPTVAIDVPFDLTSSYLEVNLGDVPLPPDIDKMCERACEDAVDCPACTGDFEASVAYVMVVVDTDMSGSIEATEVADPDNVVGIANTAVVWSNTTATAVAAPYDDQFPSGTVEGLAAYRIDASGAFVRAAEGNVYELKIGPDVF
jgi:hypothetical protein